MASMKQTRVGPKYVIAAFSLVLLLAGLYLNFLYEVPDGQELTNTWTSVFLIALGIAGILASVLWKKRRNPLGLDDSRR